MKSLKKIQLHSWHTSKANMVPFAGFDMPLVYKSPSSISKEHLAVRNHAGLFDVSHMGRMIISGQSSLRFLDRIIPRDLANLALGKVAYCYFLNEQGGFRDDLTVARIEDTSFLLTWNASNLQKIWHWINELARFANNLGFLDFEIQNISNQSGMFALQGPKAPEITKNIFGKYPGSWKVIKSTYNNLDVLILGSGYTGEAGCEIIVLKTSLENPKNALSIWETILEDSNQDNNVIPCGLGARDTLRMEAGMPLYGNEMDEKITPVECGLAFPPLISLNKSYFLGQEALKKAMDVVNITKKRVGLKAINKGPSPRAGMTLYDGDKECGYVSSGAFSPLLKIGIGQAYVTSELPTSSLLEASVSTGKKIPVKTCNFPLYDPNIYGSKRNSDV